MLTAQKTTKAMILEAPSIAAADMPEHPTYHEHARAIIEANCVACHSDGQIAAYAPLTSPEDVVLAAEDIKFHVIYGYMPPWPPSREGLPLQNDRSLSDADIALIAAWVDDGAALGDPESYVPAATDGFLIPEVRADLTSAIRRAVYARPRPARRLSLLRPAAGYRRADVCHGL